MPVPGKKLQTIPKARVASNGSDSPAIPYAEFYASFPSAHHPPITYELAKQWLGWEEETKEAKFGIDYTVLTEDKRKARCYNNTGNRPLKLKQILARKQDILTKRWRLNCETIIIGKSGRILSGQHRLIALIFAVQAWMDGPQKYYWQEIWTEEPYIESLVAFNADEDPETVRTLDNVSPRDFADIVVTSGLFDSKSAKDQETLGRMLHYAVRLLWKRTGAGNNCYTPLQTHSEGLEFVDRHQKLLDAVLHISEENGRNAIGKLISPGVAAGLLYLMGCCKSDGDAYRLMTTPDESNFDWEHWDKACEFWTLFGSRSPTLKVLRDAMKLLINSDEDSTENKIATCCLAWNQFVHGHQLEEKDCKIRFVWDEDGCKEFDYSGSDVGGIDLGFSPDDDSEPPDEPEPKKRTQGTVSKNGKAVTKGK